MATIGILLPGSTLYPSIGMDFLQGIKSCFKHHGFQQADFLVDIIGFGLKENEIYAAAEKFIVVNNADAVVVYAEDYHAEKLAPLFETSGKLLIITNSGAHYPVTATPANTIFHSLNDCLCTFLTGKYAAKQEGGKGGIMATSFFDGGYKHSHAMSNGFVLSGGEIRHNFVSHYKKDEFNTDTLTAFIKDNPEVQKLLCVLSADMARYFYQHLAAAQTGDQLQWFGSPMMFDCTPGDFAEPKPAVLKLTGYTHWVPQLDNDTNSTFLEYYRTEHGKDANLFSMQGWENALLLMEYLRLRKTQAGTTAAIAALTESKINSPRGAISLNAQKYTQGPVYLVEATGNLDITIRSSIEDTSAALQEMLDQVPAEEFSSWRNTYLCI